MRVLHVITKGELGGAQRYLAELVRRQRLAGFHVELATGTRGWLTDQRSLAGAHHVPHLVREIELRVDTAAVRDLWWLIRRRQFDVVHTHSSKAGIVGRVAAALARVPLIAHTSHGTPLAERISLRRRAVYTLAEQGGAILTQRLFAVSAAERDLLHRCLFTRPGAVRVMTIVPDYVRAMPPAWRLSEETRWDLVAIGNLYANKAYDVLLGSMALLATEHPLLRAIIYGEGPERARLAAQAAQLGLAGRVILPGSLDDVPAALTRAGIFVMPSRKEGLPLALLEAMATGVPVAATAVGAVGQTLGKHVPLARPDDESDFARLLDRLLRSDAEREHVARAGRTSLEQLVASDDPDAVRSMYV